MLTIAFRTTFTSRSVQVADRRQRSASEFSICRTPAHTPPSNARRSCYCCCITNPGGGDDHYAVAYYGTDPEDLSQTAKNNIRLNRAHPETIFRVRIQGLKSQTTYYYKVTSMGADGKSDGVESSVNHFTSAAPGQLTSAQPKSQ
jgi:hypothetical protein